MANKASDLAHRLARNAEAVCWHYLDNGRREGRYWIVGDVRNTPGRSMYVRLKGSESGKGAAGKWTDAATGEHGDLLDVIRESCGLTRKVPQVAFKPDWTRHGKAAPFKRNDAILDVLPIGVILFPGTGIQDNFADKAKNLGITAFDFRKQMWA